MTITVGDLAANRYVLLTTYRRDGRPVATPVWAVPYDGGLAVWTPASSGKVKRIRHTSEVTVASCDFRGGNVGPAATGSAEVLDPAATARVRQELKRKYGVSARLTIALSALRRGSAGSVGIKVAPR
ncbi:MAG TPA: PPOX class F420-dependent oxidoreductase [Micromonosporaceae bacterium]|nr:PPOX class F420-dependent oxidoreductase [Micromonosporaceae bacterium]